MRFQLPALSAAFRKLRIVTGSALILVVFSTGVTIGGCGDIFCPFGGSLLEFYSMRLNLWSGSAALVGLALLLSALKDLLTSIDLPDLSERGLESIADLD